MAFMSLLHTEFKFWKRWIASLHSAYDINLRFFRNKSLECIDHFKELIRWGHLTRAHNMFEYWTVNWFTFAIWKPWRRMLRDAFESVRLYGQCNSPHEKSEPINTYSCGPMWESALHTYKNDAAGKEDEKLDGLKSIPKNYVRRFFKVS